MHRCMSSTAWFPAPVLAAIAAKTPMSNDVKPAFRLNNETPRSLGGFDFQAFCKSGGGIRTRDLRVMGPTILAQEGDQASG